MKRVLMILCGLGIVSFCCDAYGIEKLNKAPLWFTVSHVIALIANSCCSNAVSANVIGVGLLAAIYGYDYLVRTQAPMATDGRQSVVIDFNHQLDRTAMIVGYLDGALFGRLARGYIFCSK